MILELIGYAASLIVAISLTMSSLLRLRIINLVGAVLFAGYGFAIGALPVALVNTFIVGVNLFYLARMLGTQEYFRILDVRPDTEYVRYYLQRNGAEIRRFLPHFDFAPAPDALAFFVLREVVPAGLFIGERDAEGTLHVRLDYVLPGYRDLKVGKFLFEDCADFLRARGVRRLVSRPGNAMHERYLRRMGFREGHGGELERRLA